MRATRCVSLALAIAAGVEALTEERWWDHIARVEAAVEERVAALEAETRLWRKELEQRVAVLEAEKRQQRTELDELHALLANMSGAPLVQTSNATADGDAAAHLRLTVATDGFVRHDGVGTGASSRRKLAGEMFLAVRPLQIHEFPSGASCNGLSNSEFKTLLSVSGGSPTWDPSPASPTADVSLTTVASDYALTEIQRHAAPLKVVHDSNCSSAPTLALQLSTTVSSLTVSSSLTIGSDDASSIVERMDLTGMVNIKIRAGVEAGVGPYLSHQDGTGGTYLVDLHHQLSFNQRWFIRRVAGTNFYHIRAASDSITDNVAEGGMPSYVSTRDDGELIDLLVNDDGSLRQRWSIVKVSGAAQPNTYHIKATGGVTDVNKIYLSASSAGLSLKLETTDDGSGRQQWIID